MLWTRTDALGETSAGGQTALLAGEPTIDEELGGLVLRISAEAFFQTNTEMAERLYALAREACDLHGWSASSTSSAAPARSGSDSPGAPGTSMASR